MTKQHLLEALHKLVWKHDDCMPRETLEALQDLIDEQTIFEARRGTIRIERLKNGRISEIKIMT